jgi:hypothetical protein
MPQYCFNAESERDILLLRKKLPDAEFIIERTDHRAPNLEVVLITATPIEKVREAMKAVSGNRLMVETLTQRYMRIGERLSGDGTHFSMN